MRLFEVGRGECGTRDRMDLTGKCEVHDHIRDRCEEIFSMTGNPGNKILEMNPALQLVFTAPAVKGTLSSILGDGYFMHPHRHCH